MASRRVRRCRARDRRLGRRRGSHERARPALGGVALCLLGHLALAGLSWRESAPETYVMTPMSRSSPGRRPWTRRRGTAPQGALGPRGCPQHQARVRLDRLDPLLQDLLSGMGDLERAGLPLSPAQQDAIRPSWQTPVGPTETCSPSRRRSSPVRPTGSGSPRRGRGAPRRAAGPGGGRPEAPVRQGRGPAEEGPRGPRGPTARRSRAAEGRPGRWGGCAHEPRPAHPGPGPRRE